MEKFNKEERKAIRTEITTMIKDGRTDEFIVSILNDIDFNERKFEHADYVAIIRDMVNEHEPSKEY